MIDAKELRIDNYVHLINSDTFYRITEIGYSEIEYPRYEASGISSEAVFRTYIENLNPIPITEELLLKSGFKKIRNRITFRIVPRISYELKYKPKDRNDACFLVFVKDNGEFNHVVPADNDKECSFVPIKSIHQLQNLYFAMTGKELEVNL